MSFILGPAGSLGHPFCATHDIPVRREIGGRIVYAFDNAWLYRDLELIPEEPVEAVVVWDPSWRRAGSDEEARSVNELHLLWELAHKHDAPLIGVYSDWFAAWEARFDMIGTPKSVIYMDAIIIDPVGAASIRAAVAPMRIRDQQDTRYRPIIEMDNYLTYGRLPTLGGNFEKVANVLVDHPHENRSIDVSFIGHKHPAAVLLRSWHLEYLIQICEASGFSYVIDDNHSAKKMEDVLLDTRVCFNSALGSQLNCRVHEAFAAGCLLLTENFNVANWSMFSAATLYRNVQDMKWQLRRLLSMDGVEANHRAQPGVYFALKHTPERVWIDVLDHVEKAIELSKETLELRLDAERSAVA